MKHYWCFNGEKYEIDIDYVKSVSDCIPDDVKLYTSVKRSSKVSYETEFRMKELEYREKRQGYDHETVVNELANIVRHADTSIEVLEGELDTLLGDNEKLKLDLVNKETDSDNELRGLYGVLVLSVALNFLGIIFIQAII